MYNYLENIKEDVKTALTSDYKELLTAYRTAETFLEKESVKEEMKEALWVDDAVTGNASGSYTFNTWQAEENLCHNWDLLEEMAEEYGVDLNYAFQLKKGAEYCDVAIRCYLLGQALAEVLEELEAE